MSRNAIEPESSGDAVSERFARDPDLWLWGTASAMLIWSALHIALFAWGRDQGIYGVLGDGLLQGKVAYRDLWDFKPPGIFFTFALAQGLFGRSMTAIRLLELSGLLATTALLIRFAEIFLRRRGVGLLAAALAALIQSQLDFWHTAQPETFGGYLTVAGLLWTVRGETRESRLASLAVAGLCFGLAALFKPPLGGGLLVCLSYWLRREAWLDPGRRHAVTALSAALLGFLAPLLAAAVWFALRDGVAAALWTLGRFTPGYTRLSWEGRTALELFYHALTEIFTKFSAVLPFGCLALLFLPSGRARENEGLLLVLGVVMVHVAGIAMQGKFFPYHYAATLPLVALLSAAGIYRVWQRAVTAGALAMTSFGVVLCLLLAMRSAVFDLPQRYLERCSLRLAHLFQKQGEPGSALMDRELTRVADYDLAADRQVALEIRSRTASDAKIFVWGFEPVIYWLAERAPASRFIYNVPQRAFWEQSFARRELMRELSQNAPEVVVVQSADIFPAVTGDALDSRAAIRQFPEFRNWLGSYYAQASRIEDFELYVRNHAPATAPGAPRFHPAEPGTAAQLEAADARHSEPGLEDESGEAQSP